MFESEQSPVDASALRSLLAQLAGPLDLGEDDDLAGAVDDAEVIEQIAALERVKNGAAARQARLAVVFDRSQRARQRAAGAAADKVGRGVGEQIALARRESPTHGSRHLGLAKALVNEMPHTMAALSAGLVSEWTATVAVRETAGLAVEDRRRVDTELADRLPTMSPARVRDLAWGAACRLDPAAAVRRNAKAVNERRVSVRPAPDTMTYLTALLPVKDGVACYAALNAAAGSAQAAGDPRGRGQVMADTLVDRLTGRAGGQPQPDPASWDQSTQSGSADASDRDGPSRGDGVAVELQLVITDDTLLRGGDAPALLTDNDSSGSNPAASLIPAQVARDLVRQAGKVFVRRLYTDPESGQLVAMESSRRVFDGNLRRMLILRDGTCRTPWCDAPVRHGDHITAHADGGPTSLSNGQGLCERCNLTKNLPGWTAETLDSGPGRHVVRTTTPTGHTYDSTAPPLLPCLRATSPTARPLRRPPRSPVERALAARHGQHALAG
jgi:hypothetical protein